MTLNNVRDAYPKKYHDLLDDEVWTFIEETAKWYPDGAVNWGVEQQRETYNALCKAFSFQYPEGISACDEFFEHHARKVGLRHYEMAGVEPKAHVIYIHGGGFVVGGLESHDSICADLCAQTGCSVTAVDYALAPEHHFPADYEDCLAAYEFMRGRNSLPFVLVGDSAGGNLCAAVSHTVRGSKNQPVGQVLIYPGLGSDVEHGSFVEHAHAPGITQADTRYYKMMRVGGDEASLAKPQCCPLNDSDFTNLPATFITVAECDPLSDDGRDYATKIENAGGSVTLVDEAGLIHGYLRARNSVEKARVSFKGIVVSIQSLAAVS